MRAQCRITACTLFTLLIALRKRWQVQRHIMQMYERARTRTNSKSIANKCSVSSNRVPTGVGQRPILGGRIKFTFLMQTRAILNFQFFILKIRNGTNSFQSAEGTCRGQYVLENAVVFGLKFFLHFSTYTSNICHPPAPT